MNDDKLISYDVVLALNIFHHFLKTEDKYNQLREFLPRLRAREMFLSCHNPSEGQMMRAYRNLSPDEFIEFVIDNSVFRKAELVGYTEAFRSLYRFS